MLIILTGESGSGKSSIQTALQNQFNVKPIVTYTTRQKRDGEFDGVDYHFVSLDEFGAMCDDNKFAEIAEYSNNRWYGSLMLDITHAIEDEEHWYSIVLTPPGLRRVWAISEFGLMNSNVFRVHVDARLDVRVKRYVERCGDKFSFADFAEIYERVQRDFGMFLNIDDECDFTLFNNGDFTLSQMAKSVMKGAQDHKDGSLRYMIARGKIKGKSVKKGPNRYKD